MRTVTMFQTLVAGALIVCIGCHPSSKSGDPAGYGRSTVRTAFTAENNPTTLSGRGEPSLDDLFRPAAWIYIDGHEGRFIDRDDHPQVQWVIDGPVGASPTFRVEVYGPLLGTPRDFKCVLRTVEAVDGSEIAYGIEAGEGTFEVGREYSLLRPGDNFVTRNGMTGDVVREIAPLAPGRYVLAGGITNSKTGVETPVVTFFTVGEGE